MKFIEVLFYIIIFLIIVGLFTDCYVNIQNPSNDIKKLFSTDPNISKEFR
jgi:hypothetical protein